LKRLLILITLLLQIVLSLSPFVPYVRDNIWVQQTSVSQFASTLASYIGLQFVCLGALVLLVLLDVKEQSVKATDDFRHLLEQYTPLNVRRLKENEFYDDFLGACISAKHYVNICYFSPRPPEIGTPASRERYYKKMVRVMTQNPDTKFRRIVRDTEANRQWTESLITRIKTATNCSIALLADTDESIEMPLALSIQIIDGEQAWLVAIAEHTGAATYRDIAVKNEFLVPMLDKYFDRLWSLSRVVFNPGDSAAKSHDAIWGATDGNHG
jgi:hypothetical protein